MNDLQRSLDFYTKHLGFWLNFNYQDFYCGIIKDGYSIHLKHGSTAIEERENRRENGHLDLVMSVDDVERFYSAIKNELITIIQPLCERPYGTEFYITDPDGYIIALLQEKQGE